jgi:hypothetical protein
VPQRVEYELTRSAALSAASSPRIDRWVVENFYEWSGLGGFDAR